MNNTSPALRGNLDPAHFAAVAFLARYSGNTRTLYQRHLARFFEWCESRNLPPLDATRLDIELYVRYLQDVRHNKASSIGSSMSAVKGMYKFASIDGLIARNPAEYALVPKVNVDDLKMIGLERSELMAMLSTARVISTQHWALVSMLGLLGMRVSEACGVQIGDFDNYQRGHRTIKFIGKGNKPATMPLPVPVQRALDEARGDCRSGPLLVRKCDGGQLDRHNASWMVQTIAKRAGIERKVSPHTLRHAFVAAALDAHVPLRDVQIAARHADPRTTARYDRSREQLDRHAVHYVSAFIAGS